MIPDDCVLLVCLLASQFDCLGALEVSFDRLPVLAQGC